LWRRSDRRRFDNYIPHAKGIVVDHLIHKDDHLDRTEAADLVMPRLNIALRVRRPGFADRYPTSRQEKPKKHEQDWFYRQQNSPHDTNMPLPPGHPRTWGAISREPYPESLMQATSMGMPRKGSNNASR
jgi:hypothetical protein